MALQPSTAIEHVRSQECNLFKGYERNNQRKLVQRVESLGERLVLAITECSYCTSVVNLRPAVRNERPKDHNLTPEDFEFVAVKRPSASKRLTDANFPSADERLRRQQCNRPVTDGPNVAGGPNDYTHATLYRSNEYTLRES